jgi:ribosomal protein S18 acetylase RimI-like enzyme
LENSIFKEQNQANHGDELTHWWDNNKNNSNNNNSRLQQHYSQESREEFFIRESMMVDMGRASKILADGFFKDNTNFITYQFERLETYLSLESGFPKPSTLHQIFVACEATAGRVIGVAEVDARLDGGQGVRGKNGPYMCNVAVDQKFQRKKIASALVQQCESQVHEWVRQSSSSSSSTVLSNSLYLKVRGNNQAAVAMYDKLGYRSMRQEKEEKTDLTVLIMRKQLSRLESPERASAAKSMSKNHREKARHSTG